MNLGLGTVQFGMPYGVTNRVGQIPMQEATDIVSIASRIPETMIDTAPTYGSCETILGQILTPHHFRIVTKTLPLSGTVIHKAEAGRIRDRFYQSLEFLKQKRIYGLMIHHAGELQRPGAEELIDVLQDLKRQRLVEKIGVSIYSGVQIDHALSLFKPDIIQVPVNVFDQRLLVSGHLAKLNACGVEIVARSVFLQGILLTPPDQLPPHFKNASGILEHFRTLAQRHGMTPLQAALHFLSCLAPITTALVGVSRLAEFRQIVDAWTSIPSVRLDYSEFAIEDEAIVNPTFWPAPVS